MQDRQNRAIPGWGKELVGVPTRGERSGFGFAITDHATNDQVRVVECGAVSVRQGVPELAALVDRAGRLGCHMAGNPPWEGELSEQAAQALGVEGDIRVDLTVGPLEVRVGNDTRPAVAGAHDVDRV